MLKTAKQIAEDSGRAERLAVVAIRTLGLLPDVKKPHAGRVACYYGEEAQARIREYFALPRSVKRQLHTSGPRKRPGLRVPARHAWTLGYIARCVGCSSRGVTTLLALHGFTGVEALKQSTVSLEDVRAWYQSLPGETPRLKGRYLFAQSVRAGRCTLNSAEKLEAARARAVASQDLSVWATREQAAEFLGKNDTTSYALYKQSGFRFKKVGRTLFYMWEDLKTLQSMMLAREGHLSSLADVLKARLSQEGFEYTTEKAFPDLVAKSKPMRFDFCLPSLGTLIEVQGCQHFTEGYQGFSGKPLSLEEIQRRDTVKRDYAATHGWDLLWVSSLSDVGDVVAYLRSEPLDLEHTWPQDLLEDYGAPALSRYDGAVGRFCWLHRGHFPYHRAGMVLKRIHRSYWNSCTGAAKSPYTTWTSRKEVFFQLVANRLRYHPALQTEDPFRALPSLSVLVAGFGIAKISPPASFFSPSLGEALIQQFALGSTIVDPFSGFSGRALAAFRKGKAYRGFDISAIRVAEAQEVVSHYGMTQAVISQADAAQAPVQDWPNATLLTCPPYGDKESWDGIVGYKAEDYWIHQVLMRHKCLRYIFVVGHTDRYAAYTVPWEASRRHPFFTKGSRQVLVIDRSVRDDLVAGEPESV